MMMGLFLQALLHSGLSRLTAATGEVKRLFVAQAARGCGVGRAFTADVPAPHDDLNGGASLFI
jgi:hypothetical protein